MIKTNNSGSKLNSGEVKQVLTMLSGLLPKSVFKAITFLLHPCCVVTLRSAEAVCTDNYDFTVALNSELNLLGKGIVTLYLNGIAVSSQPWNDGTSITFTDVSGSAGNQEIYLSFFLPTNTDESIGVTLISDTIPITTPSCA